MSMPEVLLIALVFALAATTVGWLFMTEASYLGSGAVRRFYDFGSRFYDASKGRLAAYRFSPEEDRRWLLPPLLPAIERDPHCRVLDVATGSGRVPLLLLGQPGFLGSIVGLDLSEGMLRVAREKLGAWVQSGRVALIKQDASYLPFEDVAFDVVSSTESWEFFPHPEKALGEMARVLKPGGILLLSKQRDSWALWMYGRSFTRKRVAAMLEQADFTGITIVDWQRRYDLAWGTKAGMPAPGPSEPPGPWDSVRCPVCQSQLLSSGQGLTCSQCRGEYPIRQGILYLA
ncbi:MAG: methyltransferase domain-containing protein [Chloroflexi bacterium]|nr:methyltransferase domain-containing protein [Chloroflexota bacterium]